MDITKLKYYQLLCDKEIISEGQDEDIDSIINTLEEKQFELLKRLETVADEKRKEEINETLSIIDLQLKEVGSIKDAINAGIIVDASGSSLETEEHEQSGDNKGKNGGKKGIIFAAIAFVVLCAVAGFVFMQKGDTQQATSSEDNTPASEATTEEDDNVAKIGVSTFDGAETQKQMEEQDSWVEGVNLAKGLYVYEITNQTLIDGGLELGDHIMSLNGENVTADSDLFDIRQKYSPGDDCVFKVSRGPEVVTIKGKFIKPSEALPEKTSGEEIFYMEGGTFRVTYNADETIGLSMWDEAGE